MTSPAWENESVQAFVRGAAKRLTEGLLAEATAARVVEDVYTAHRPLLEKQGWHVESVLGSGQNGTAYALRDGRRVMKITLDDSEARSSFALQGQRNEYIVNIEKVFKLPPVDGLDLGGKTAYVLIQERLHRLSDADVDELKWAFNIIDGLTDNDTGVWTRGWDHLVRALVETLDRRDDEDREGFVVSVRPKMRDHQRAGRETPKGDPVRAGLQLVLGILKRFRVDGMMDELLERGIRYHDYHPGNILRRENGEYVVNDLGVSKAHADLDPPQLERALRESPAEEARVHALVKELVPLALKYAVYVCGSMKSCGSVSDVVANVAEGEGVPCMVVSVPGHFYNVFPFPDGRGLLVDVTALQFQMKYGSPRDTDDDDERREIRGQMSAAVGDPFRFVKIREMSPDEVRGARRVSSGAEPVGGKMTLDRLRRVVAREEAGLNEAAPDGTMDTGAMLRQVQPGKKRLSRSAGFNKIIETHEDLLEKYGLIPQSVLGEGQKGIAYALKDPTKVLKITSDPDEARASYRVQQLGGVQGVVKIERVFKFPDRPDHFGIVQERLQKLPEDVDKMFMWAFKTIMIGLFGGKGMGNSDQGWPKFVKSVERELRLRDIEGPAQGPYRKALAVYKGLKLDRVMDALVNARIRFHDLHPGNLMMRAPGEYVVVDLGVSDVAGGKEPPVLERFVQEAARRIAEGVTSVDVRRIQPILAKHGIELGEQVGEGSMGIAYELQGRPNVVVKVTDDAQEAASSQRVKTHGRNLKHVVRIYDVRRIPPATSGLPEDVFVIVQERLEPLSDAEEQKAVAIGRMTKLLSPAIPDERQAAAKYFAQKMGPDQVGPILSLLDSVEYFETMAELRSIGVRFRDYHAGNVMKRGQDFVVLDLGVSRVRGGAAPPDIDAGGLKTEAAQVVRGAAFDEIRRALEGRGVRLGARLGSGDNGDVYEIQGKPGTVLKITGDEVEARAAQRLKGLDLRHVYRVFDVRRASGHFLIFQERLEPLPDDYADWFDRTVAPALHVLWKDSYKDQERVRAVLTQAFNRRAPEMFQAMRKFQVVEMLGELQSAGIWPEDLHGGNIMVRGDDYVVVDIGGTSRVPGGSGEAEDLEDGELRLERFDPCSLREWRMLLEGPADRVAVVAGTLSPFSAKQADFVRRVANSVDKTVLLIRVDGLATSSKLDLVRASLRDVERKVEVFPMPPGNDLLGSLEGLVDRSAALRPGVAFELYVPQDSMESARAGLASSGVFGESPVVVRPIDQKVAGEDREASGVLRKGDVEAAKAVLDPHVFSDPEEAETIVQSFGSSSRVEGFAVGVADALLETLEFVDTKRLEAALRKSGVPLGKLLGAGNNGIAYLHATDPTLVIKVTDDSAEISAAKLLKGKSLRHVVKIIDVVRAPGKMRGDDGPVFLIFQEKLAPLSQSEMRAVDFVQMNTNAYEHPIELQPKNKILAGLREQFKSNPKTFEKVNQILNKLQVFEINDEIMSLGISGLSYELSSDDLMKRGRDVVAIDLLHGSDNDIDESLQEDLKSIGGSDTIQGILGANATSLKTKKQIDIEKLEMLGSGEKGTAFRIRPGLVLKVTTDKKEARSSMLVRDKSMRNVVKIDDVFRFGNTPGVTEEVYGIVMEELEPLDDFEEGEINRAMMRLHDIEDQGAQDHALELLANGKFEDLKAVVKSLIVQDMGSEAASPGARRKVELRAEAAAQAFLDTLDKYKIPDMVKELNAAGVQYADFKGANMGKRSDGSYVVFDLGASLSQGSEPAVFEALSGLVGNAAGAVSHDWAKGPTGRSEPKGEEWEFEDERPTLGRLSAP